MSYPIFIYLSYFLEFIYFMKKIVLYYRHYQVSRDVSLAVSFDTRLLLKKKIVFCIIFVVCIKSRCKILILRYTSFSDDGQSGDHLYECCLRYLNLDLAGVEQSICVPIFSNTTHLLRATMFK
jgi:hypothetical protein